MTGVRGGFRDWLRRVHIQKRIALFLAVLLTASAVATFLVSSFLVHRTVGSYMDDSVLSSQRQIVTSIEMQLDELIMISLRIKSSREVHRALDGADRQALRDTVSGVLRASGRTSIGDICIINGEGQSFFCRLNGIQLVEPDAQFLASVRETNFYVCGEVAWDQAGRPFLPIGMRYHDYYTGLDAGCLILYLDEEALYDIYKETVPDFGYSFLLSGRSTVLSHPEKSRVGRRVEQSDWFRETESASQSVRDFDGEKSVVAVYPLSERMQGLGFPWEVVSVISYQRMFAAEEQVRGMLVLLGAGMLVLALLLTIALSERLTTSLRLFKGRLQTLGEGRLLPIPDTGPHDEIWELENGYNEMVVRINGLIDKNNEEKEKKRELEFAALQAQINPHFLYNTLDVIGWMAKLRGQDDIEKLVMELAQFFRMSLHKGERLISIRDELELVRCFVTIEQMRNPGKFEISYDADEGVEEVLLPKIVLQPLVENAIKHGVSQKRRKGRIRVSVRRLEERIRLTVEDDGAGFDPGSTDLKGCDATQHSGYGLRNVDERLKLEYGAGYGLTIESRPGEGTRASLDIGYREAEKEPDANRH